MAFNVCECLEAGWCARHQCLKSPGLHARCQIDPRMFSAWEAGRGPCLAVPPDEERIQDGRPPNLAQRVLRFGAALAKHASDGLRRVDDATYEARLEECRRCQFYAEESLTCLQRQCGCNLRIKARWASEACPIGRWAAVEAETDGSDGDP